MSQLISRKRTFDDLEQSVCDSQVAINSEPSFKKQKLSNIKIHSSIFPNSKDQNEFVSYFNIIKQSELSHNIPSDIIREIAEYSTGKIQQCSRNKCLAGICVLNEDINNFINDKPLKWNYCSIKNKYFCSECLPFTAKFDCCNTVQCTINSHECFWHSADDNKTMCTFGDMIEDDKVFKTSGFKCIYCNDDDGFCDSCNKWMCSMHRHMRFVCPTAQHNDCCQIAWCGMCGHSICIECNGIDGFSCIICYIFVCEDCCIKPSSGNFCGKCQEFICDGCDDKKVEFCGKCDFVCHLCREYIKKNVDGGKERKYCGHRNS